MISSILARLAGGDLEGLRAALLDAPPSFPVLSEYDLDPGPRAPRRILAEAAVLLPIILKRAPAVLFTRRTGHLPRHAGQVSFPGGRHDARDASPVETALRETHEETGIDPGFVTIAGFLDGYETGTGYAIRPVVGVLSEGYVLAPDAQEVEEIFEVPLGFLLDPANRRLETRERDGRAHRFHVFQYGAHTIWGATAAILVDLQRRLAAAPTPHDKARPAPVDNPHADRS